MNGADEMPRARLALGLDPALVGINHADQIMLDHLMFTHPEWANIIELGTYTGITALLLGMTCRVRDGKFWTVNKTDDRVPQVKAAWLPNMTQLFMDILPGDCAQGGLARLIEEAAPCLVIFDNGNKADEVRRYAQYVQPGSGIAVHDFNDDPNGGEVVWAQVADVLTADKWADLALAERNEWGSGFRCWMRI